MTDLTANQKIIVDALLSGLDNVTAISEKTGISVASVSANLKPLRAANIVAPAVKVAGKSVLSLTTEFKVCRVDSAFDKAITAAAATEARLAKVEKTVAKALAKGKAPKVIVPTTPREHVINLIRAGFTKKVAKAHVYDRKALPVA